MMTRIHLIVGTEHEGHVLRAPCGARGPAGCDVGNNWNFTPELLEVTCQRCMAIATKGRKAA